MVRTTTRSMLRPKEKPIMSSPTRTVEEVPAQPRSAGALTFAPDGMLFVGDSKSGAVFAYPNPGPAASRETVEPFLFEDIDRRIAEALQVNERALTFNGMAVQPLTRELHISVGIKGGEKLEACVCGRFLAR
jgi:hypothetical protein